MHPWQIILPILCLSITSSCFADQTYGNNRSNRQLAVTQCHDYRERYRMPCFVSRFKCPAGFETIQQYRSGRGVSYLACRDSRHERPVFNKSALQHKNLKPRITHHFHQFLKQVQEQQTGDKRPLSQSLIKQLNTYFIYLKLDTVFITVSEALSTGCFTDCGQIYCAASAPISQWSQTGEIPFSLIQMLAHVERCEIQGGQSRYLQSWLRHIPENFLSTLRAGEPVSAHQLQFASYLKEHTKNRAESICRRLSCAPDHPFH
jgi:hypothetical protein